jgi:PQQ-like domain
MCPKVTLHCLMPYAHRIMQMINWSTGFSYKVNRLELTWFRFIVIQESGLRSHLKMEKRRINLMNSSYSKTPEGQVEITDLDGQIGSPPDFAVSLSRKILKQRKLIRGGLWPVMILLFLFLTGTAKQWNFATLISPGRLLTPMTQQRSHLPPMQEGFRTVFDGLTFISARGILTARNSHGSIQWHIPTHALITSVLAVSNREVYLKVHWWKTFLGELEALRESDGAVLWRRPYTGSVFLTVQGTTLYLNNYTLHALRASDGAVLWRYQNPRGIQEGYPVLHDDGTITIQTLDGVVITLYASNGTIVSPTKQAKLSLMAVSEGRPH